MEEEIVEKALKSLGKGFDLASDFRLKLCKGEERLVVLNETERREIRVPGFGPVRDVSIDIKCDKGDRTRYQSDILTFTHMSELFNQKSSIPGKIPSGCFNAVFGFEGSWASDAANTKYLGLDGYFITLFNIHIDRYPLLLSKQVLEAVPSSWDPPSLARFIEKFGTHILVGLSIGGKDLVLVKQDVSSNLGPSELKNHLDDLGDQLFNGTCNFVPKTKERRYKVPQAFDVFRSQIVASNSSTSVCTKDAQLYTILEMCRAFDKVFKEHLDGGRPGGDKIYGVFDHQLPAALKKLPFDRHLALKNVQRVVTEADGYQPHLIAPEQGYRRLIDGSISYFKGPAEASVDAVHFVLKELVRKSIVATEELKRFPTLSNDIATAANESLERFREESRKTVLRLVDMESSYLTVEFFRKIHLEPEKNPNAPNAPNRGGTTIDNYTDNHLRKIGSNVNAYIGMVCETLKNSIPKAVVYCQVREAKRSLLNRFYLQVGRKEVLLHGGH